MSKSTIVTLFLTLLFFFEGQAQTYEDKKSEKVVEAYLEAVGGKENWDAVWSRSDTALHSGLENMSKKVSQINRFIEKDEITVSIYQEGMYYRETLNDIGISSSKHNGVSFFLKTKRGTLIPFPQDQSDFMKEGLTLVRGYPHRIIESKSIKYLGKKKVNDSFYDAVLVSYNLIGGTIFYFDTKTHLLIYSHSQGHRNMLTEHTNYKKVDNLLIPFEEVIRDNGVLISTTKIQSITLNQLVNSSIFD